MRAIAIALILISSFINGAATAFMFIIFVLNPTWVHFLMTLLALICYLISADSLRRVIAPAEEEED